MCACLHVVHCIVYSEHGLGFDDPFIVQTEVIERERRWREGGKSKTLYEKKGMLWYTAERKIEVPSSRRFLQIRAQFTLQLTRKFYAWDINSSPKDIRKPKGYGQADNPPNKSAETPLKLGLAAGYFPDIVHQRKAETV